MVSVSCLKAQGWGLYHCSCVFGGIRVVGQNHTIINNYIADVDDEADGAISFAAGVPNTPLNGYLQVRDTVVAHNTVVNVAGAGITFTFSPAQLQISRPSSAS